MAGKKTSKTGLNPAREDANAHAARSDTYSYLFTAVVGRMRYSCQPDLSNEKRMNEQREIPKIKKIFFLR